MRFQIGGLVLALLVLIAGCGGGGGNNNALTFTVTPAAGANGTISPSTPQTVNSGAGATFTAAPATGYTVNTWTLDGTAVQTGGTTYTLANVTAKHTVNVTFTALTSNNFTVSPTAGANGAISPSTPQTVNSGGSATFTATPATGYTVNTWMLDGTAVQTGGTTYTLANVTAKHTVNVTFAPLTAGAIGTLQGYIYTASGKLRIAPTSRRDSGTPVVGAIVSVRGNASLTATTDSTGAFTLYNVPCGDQTLYIAAPGYAREETAVQVNQGNNSVTAPQLVSAPYKWTFLVYLDADNDLASASEGNGVTGIDQVNFSAMEAVGSTQDVEILVQWSRMAAYVPAGAWSGCRRYAVQKVSSTGASTSQMLQNMGNVDMGNSTTLQQFVTWGEQYAPAEHFMLDIWDHGSGWDTYDDRSARAGVRAGASAKPSAKPSAGTQIRDRAIAYDTLYNDCITIEQLPAALTAAHPLDIVACDACLMAMTEIAYEVKNQTDYWVACEDESPWAGFDYTGMLAKLTSASGLAMTPAQYAAFCAQDIQQFWGSSQGSTTISAIDCTKIGAVAGALSNLAVRLQALVNTDSSGANIAEQNAETFGLDLAPDNFTDLYSYAEIIQSQVADPQVAQLTTTLENAIQSAVLSNNSYGEYNGYGNPDTHGLSVYLPSAASYQANGQNYPLLQMNIDYPSWMHWLAVQ